MVNLPVPIPRTAIQDFGRAVVPETISLSEPVELVVRMEEEALRLREISAYLFIIDRFYGRLHEAGLVSYSHRASEHLRITTVQTGSIEAIISEVGQFIDRNQLVLLWILLRGIPRAAVYLSQSARNVLASFRDVQEGLLAKEQRKRLQRAKDLYEGPQRVVRSELRELIRSEPAFEELPNKRVAQIARLLESLYQEERDNLPAAARFALRHVREVILKVGDRHL